MTVAEPASSRRRKWLTFVPFGAFLGLATLFYISLRSGDPSRLPSALIGKKAPDIDLPPLRGFGDSSGLNAAAFAKGKATLVNVFASWCAPCRDEHPVLLQLSKDPELVKKGVQIAGIAYKDAPANSGKFLGELGNPYAVIGVDESGRAGIEWGVYGVPETFVVRNDGTIIYKFVGPLDNTSLRSKLLPEIDKALQ
jgi:cytochrome c biogenesis protein CcmG, thiol:disulfide interchange protein DsbE